MTRLAPKFSPLAALALASSLCLGVVPGCESGSTGGTATPGSGGPRRGAKIRELEGRARASGEPAERYGVAQDHQLNAIEESILAEVLERGGAAAPGGLVHDVALSSLAQDLAALSPSRYDMPPTLLDALMAWHGVSDPQPALVVVELEGTAHGCHVELRPDCAGAVEALVEEVQRSFSASGGGRWRAGVGVAAAEGGAKTRLIVTLVERGIELEPIPVQVERNAGFRVAGRLIGRRAKPRIEVVDPKGKWSRKPAAVGDDGSIQTNLGCDVGAGVYQIEVLADGDTGPEVVANFRVFCGVEQPREIRYRFERLGPEVQASDIVIANFELLNHAREVRGLPPLAWDDRAAEVARLHGEDMVRSGFVGHVSPNTGDPAARFARAKIRAEVVRENVARGYGPKGIHESLMNSPGHRANVIATDITHVGIGVVFGPPESSAADAPRPVFLTQNFFAKPGASTPDKPVPALRESVDGTRRGAGLPALNWDKALSKLAQLRADAGAGVGPKISDEEFQERAGDTGVRGLSIHQVSGSFRQFLTLDLWTELGTDVRVGIGIAQAGEAGAVMVILVGR